MEINNSILTFTMRRQQVANQNIISADNISNKSHINFCINDTGMDNTVSDTSNIFSTLNNIGTTSKINYVTPTTIKLATTISNLDPQEYSRIKLLIYNLHHDINNNWQNANPPSGTPGGGNGTDIPDSGSTDVPGGDGTDIPEGGDTEVPGGNGTDIPEGGDTEVPGGDDTNIPEDDDTEPSAPPPTTPDVNSNSYKLFTYMNSQDSSITISSGVTKAQLVSFTQNDRWEDSHNDFFGSLNRVWDKIDIDDNEILSFEEISKLIDDITTLNDFQNEIEIYSDQLQAYYETLSAQGKLEFAIEKTREYLEAAGLTNQIKALDRLLAGRDLHNSIASKGQITIKDLNKDSDDGTITLGAYAYGAFFLDTKYTNPTTGYTQNICFYADDEDTAEDDRGLTLDKSLLNDSWYALVDTFVHELTHATAYLYFSNTPVYEDGVLEGYLPYFSLDNLKNLREAGAITTNEYNYYAANLDKLDYAKYYTTFNEDDFNYLMYKGSAVYGEYFAYQADADYADSIAGDVFNPSPDITTAVDGVDEEDVISDHIDDLYNTATDKEPKPDWNWVSYA